MHPRLRTKVQLYVLGAFCVGIFALQAWAALRGLVSMMWGQ